MGHVTLNFHGVESIEAERPRTLYDGTGRAFLSRTIIVTDDTGATLRISLFASDEQKLFMLGDPAPAVDVPAKIEEAA